MAGIDIFANYMAELDEAADPGTIRSTLEKLQTLLASAEASHDRIVYLETLGKQVPEYRDDATPVADPLTASQRAACVEKGLIGAWEAGDVEAGDLAKLGHSVEGLGHFTDVLFKTPEDRRHRSWRDAFDAPLKPIRVDLVALARHKPIEPVRSIVSVLISDWIESMKPARPLPSFGFRGESTRKLALDPYQSQLPGETLSRLIDELSDMQSGLPEIRIGKAWARIPWQEFKRVIGNSGTWHDFLSETGSMLAETFSGEEIAEFCSWVNVEARNTEKHQNALRLFEILLLCAAPDCRYGG